VGRNAKALLLPIVVRGMRFSKDRLDLNEVIPSDRWSELLALTDDAYITLPLVTLHAESMPPDMRHEIESRRERNLRRHLRIVNAHAAFADAMRANDAEFLILKGLTHEPFWGPDARLRTQYDIDLYCPPEFTCAALKAAASLGYEPVHSQSRDSDHLPVMIRRTGWRWRDDYYDPDQPLALEIHHRFWTPDLGFAVHGHDQFWRQRTISNYHGIDLPALHPIHRLTYAAWHAVRHLLQGSLRIGHIYELARFLHKKQDDDEFWREWLEESASPQRLPEWVALRLAQEWFGCSVNPIVERCLHPLAPDVERWFHLFGPSAIRPVGNSNKDELFLNLCLIASRRDRYRVAMRRMAPPLIPAALLDAHVLSVSPTLRWRRALYRTGVIARRALHHARTVAPVVRSSFRWWWSSRWAPARRQPSPQ
jgi:hypothetical protein